MRRIFIQLHIVIHNATDLFTTASIGCQMMTAIVFEKAVMQD